MLPLPARAGRAMAATALGLSAACLALQPASAQTALNPLSPGQSSPGQTWSEPGYNGFATEDLQNGVAIRAQIDVVFQPGLSDQVAVMQNQFATGAVGVNATTEYIFEVLNQAALNGLQEALMRGARSGRATVVATGCEVGLDGRQLRTYAPVGVFINTTDMLVGDDGMARFRTSVQFIPDASTVALNAIPSPVPNW
jgi:hypothetical protein